VGAPADASILELVEGPVEFVDTRNNKRTGKAYQSPSARWWRESRSGGRISRRSARAENSVEAAPAFGRAGRTR